MKGLWREMCEDTDVKEESKYLSANYHEICVKSLLTVYFVLVTLLVFKYV